ncbi:MAG: phosphatidylinositol kinase, partial [Verrucomicrobia bacterium]|nr:phosphatidylinositol kinase [Verrucomicrobiota bacterium]
ALRDICAFDLVANNTDRKSGHCLLGTDGRVWAIDHGVCFSADFKLRTVIWEFAGEPLPAHLAEGAARIAGQVPDAVADLLSRDEVDALRERAEWLADAGAFPHDHSGSRYPWPLV